MTTKISFLITDEIAEQMNNTSPNIYFDVFGKVWLHTSEEDPFAVELVGQWWKD